MRNIIITGGELFNKGAQAMTFITIDEMKKRFPDHEIYLLSAMDLQRPEDEREMYAFKFTGWYPIKFANAQHSPALRFICRIRHGAELAAAERLYKACDLMIDVSGYALGSNWSYANCNNYLEHIEFAKAFGIPVYLMPQSFGPFDFTGEKSEELNRRIRDDLAYASAVCVREQDGYNALVSHYSLTNVVIKYDLVLNNQGINLNNIYKRFQTIQLPVIESGSIGIIPNGRTTVIADESDILKLYQAIISYLVDTCPGNVYLMSHSTQDKALCTKIKKLFKTDSHVVYLDRDFSCVEFNLLVARFDYIIASRFHSIVHAFKNGVPCISLGWAVKYQELLKQFDQEDYAFDLRLNIDSEAVISAIHSMNLKHGEQSAVIKSHLADVQKENVFDILPCQI